MEGANPLAPQDGCRLPHALQKALSLGCVCLRIEREYLQRHMQRADPRKGRKWLILAGIVLAVLCAVLLVPKRPWWYYRYQLYLAIVRSDVAAVRPLLRRHPEYAVEPFQRMGATPLHVAATHANADVLDLIVLYGADIEEKAYGNDCTPLHCSALRGNMQAMSFLMSFGAKVDSLDRHGQTPLQYAAHNNRPDAIEFLVEQGADINTRSSTYGRTPIAEAVDFHGAGACKALLKLGAEADLDALISRAKAGMAAAEASDDPSRYDWMDVLEVLQEFKER